MKHHVTIGVVCLARKTFDYQAAEKLYENIQKDLSKIKNTKFECIKDLVIEIADAKEAACYLSQKNVDGLICISGTFHLGHLVLEINKVLKKPILLWGLPELPYDGGKIRLNSICGVNLDASNLYKSQIRNYYVDIGDAVNEDWIDAIRIDSALSSTHLGIAGSRAHGFFNIGVYDPFLYRSLGVLIDHYGLHEIFDTEVSSLELSSRIKEIESIFDVSGISEEQLEKVGLLAAKIYSFMNKYGLDALALRCWPEFAETFGIAPCAAMSILQSEKRIIACEGDIDGAISMLAHQAIGAETPFLFDFSQLNLKENYALLWHCGVAPCNLWDEKSKRSLDTYFAGGKGVTADFVLKEGDVSICRFDSAGEEYRLFLQKARGLSMDKELKGTYLKVEFDEPVMDILEKIIYNGIAHHASMVYGDYIKPIEIYARIKGLRIIE